MADTATLNPHLDRFLRWMEEGARFGQVWVRSQPPGFELRHVDDIDQSLEFLREIPLAELRAWAREDAAGRFRPLSGAPDLRTGWFTAVDSPRSLELALHHLYPGGLADWFHSHSDPPPVTDFPVFAARQSGIYRGVASLAPEAAHSVVEACCDPRFCLKRRLWEGHSLPPESAEQKSVIPCLEPCAVLLEFARRCARIEQEPRSTVEWATDDLRSLVAALEAGLRNGVTRTDLRAGDVGDPSHPRRLLRVLNLLKKQLPIEPASPPGTSV